MHHLPTENLIARLNIAQLAIDPSVEVRARRSTIARVLLEVAAHAACNGRAVRGIATAGRSAPPPIASPAACWGILTTYRIGVPRTRNDGSLVLDPELTEILIDAATSFGGVTLHDVGGVCLDVGHLEVDWALDLEVWSSNEDAVLQFAASIAAKLDQRCVPVREYPTRVRFILPR